MNRLQNIGAKGEVTRVHGRGLAKAFQLVDANLYTCQAVVVSTR